MFENKVALGINSRLFHHRSLVKSFRSLVPGAWPSILFMTSESNFSICLWMCCHFQKKQLIQEWRSVKILLYRQAHLGASRFGQLWRGGRKSGIWAGVLESRSCNRGRWIGHERSKGTVYQSYSCHRLCFFGAFTSAPEVIVTNGLFILHLLPVGRRRHESRVSICLVHSYMSSACHHSWPVIDAQ